MKTPVIVGIGLIALGVVLGVLHFTGGKFPLAAAGGVLIGGVAVLFASKCGT